MVQVAFNDSQKDMWEELFNKKLVSQQFSEFVKSAFYDKIDDIRLKSGLVIDCKQIEQITQDQIMKLSKSTI